MDFMTDGRRLRLLTMVDVCTRECLAIEVGQRLRSDDVVRVLTRVAAKRGAPRRICCHNSSEYQSRLVDLWAYTQKVQLEFSRPGKPADNAHIESFDGTSVTSVRLLRAQSGHVSDLRARFGMDPATDFQRTMRLRLVSRG